jgi:hypothetical protein
MSQNQTDTTPTPVAAEEDFNTYERRYYGLNTEETSDAPAVQPEAETAAPSEDAEKEPEQVDSDEPETEEGTEQKKGSRGVEKRISKLVRERDELRRQLAEKQAADKPATETASAKPAAPAAPGFTQPKPKLENFDSLEAYTEAVTDWKLEAKEHERTQAEAKRKAEDEAKALVSGWTDRQEKARDKYDDYDERLEGVNDIAVPAELQRVILESEVGPEIAYALAGNKKELQRIVALHPLAAAREIGKLEAKLSAQETAAPKQTKPVSKAPTPIRPVSGGKAAPTPSVYDESLDYNAWEKVRNAQLRKRAA